MIERIKRDNSSNGSKLLSCAAGKDCPIWSLSAFGPLCEWEEIAVKVYVALVPAPVPGHAERMRPTPLPERKNFASLGLIGIFTWSKLLGLISPARKIVKISWNLCASRCISYVGIKFRNLLNFRRWGIFEISFDIFVHYLASLLSSWINNNNNCIPPSPSLFCVGSFGYSVLRQHFRKK